MLKTLFATALTAAVAGSTVAGDVPSIYSPRNVRIDGKLDDAVYRKAPVIKSFTRADGRAVERATECQIVFTPTSVVFAFTAYIPKDKQKALFAQYVSYAAAHNEMGIGLGLYASKKIIEGHGGNIFVESYNDNRNSFGFRIPIAQKDNLSDKLVQF